MIGNFFTAIKNLFSALFGGGSTPTPTPGKPTENIPEKTIPQDGSEIKPDTIVVTTSEKEVIKVDPNQPDADFEDDVFSQPTNPPSGTGTTQPQPQPQPKPQPEQPPVVAEKPKPETPRPDPKPKPEPEPKPSQPKGRYTWCLDNGHGKQTKGKRSPVFDDGTTQFFEYEFNRDIVNRIAKALDEHKVHYFITVPEVDIDDFLEGRVNRANSHASELPKLFVSVHANAAPARSANDWASASISGIETWYYHGSKRGQKLASVFQKYLIAKTGWVNRHIKSQPDKQFYVLRKTSMTAVLTENGFYNNKNQAAELLKDEVRQKIADAHVAAILEVEKDGL